MRGRLGRSAARLWGPALGTRLRRAARLRAAVGAALRPATRALGFDLVERNYHSPVPDVRALPDLWGRPSELRGIAFDLAEQAAFLERELAPYVAEFAPPLQPTAAGGFHLRNDSYESVDAEALYAMVRWSTPRRVLELGSGWSTFVIAEARKRNEAAGHPLSHRVFDPYPVPALATRLAELADLGFASALDVPEEEFTKLEAGDILFVDTTHVVKAGSEVNRIVLDVLPILRPGVLVHFHDIFLPWEYPADWILRRRIYWNEQYLLQAFLTQNREYELLLAADALVRARPDVVSRVVPSYVPGVEPGAFWIRRVSPSSKPSTNAP